MRITLVAIAILASIILAAQDPAALTQAKALDEEIQKAKDLPDDVRPGAMRNLALRVRQQPVAYIAALAFNLAASATEADGRDTLQQVADTITDALRRSPVQSRNDDMYKVLAELVHYGGVVVSLDDTRYGSAIGQLKADDKQRNDSDFTLRGMKGQQWHLKAMHGKVFSFISGLRGVLRADGRFLIWRSSRNVSETRDW